MCCVQSRQLLFLTYAAVCPCMPLSGVKAPERGKNVKLGCHRDPPPPLSSVHHCSHSLPISSGGSVVQLCSSLLLPFLLFSLCSLSSNSIAIQELRCDPNAASSVIKRIPSEDGFCHLNCLFWAHVTSNSPCVAPVFENIINSCLCLFFSLAL